MSDQTKAKLTRTQLPAQTASGLKSLLSMRSATVESTAADVTGMLRDSKRSGIVQLVSAATFELQLANNVRAAPASFMNASC